MGGECYMASCKYHDKHEPICCADYPNEQCYLSTDGEFLEFAIMCIKEVV